MSILSANTNPYLQSSRAAQLLPGHIQESSIQLVRFIKDYYDYLNSPSGPTTVLEELIKNRDIDSMSEQYLDAIQTAIAKSLPDSIVIDRRRLYKIVRKYYSTRGSEESLYLFFKLFFNESVSIVYPKLRLFQTSTAQGKTSTIFKLHDGHYWQKYSYEIRSTTEVSKWKNAFTKFAHPAGLKLFFALLVIAYNSNTWPDDFYSYIDNFHYIDVNEYWENINWDIMHGYHSPLLQPNILFDLDYIFYVIINETTGYRDKTHLVNGVSLSDSFASVTEIFLSLLLQSSNSSASIFRKDYQSWLKFYDDNLPISHIEHLIIGDASEEYKFDSINNCRFEALSTFVYRDYLEYQNPNSYVYHPDPSIAPDNWTQSYVEIDITESVSYSVSTLPDYFIYFPYIMTITIGGTPYAITLNNSALAVFPFYDMSASTSSIGRLSFDTLWNSQYVPPLF